MIPKTSKPPGKKLVKNMSARTKWLIMAPLALVLIGAGLCVFSEASELKHNGKPFIRWFLMGTYSLILVNGGVVMFGQAVIFKTLSIYRSEMRREIKKVEKELTQKLKKKKETDS